MTGQSWLEDPWLVKVGWRIHDWSKLVRGSMVGQSWLEDPWLVKVG